LVELTHDRHAFGLAMGSLAFAVIAIVGVMWWLSHRNAPPAVAAATIASPVATAGITISIRDPHADAVITVGTRVSVLVAATSDASPLNEVSLHVDGKEVGRRRAPPYGFLLDALPLGVHRLVAKAETVAGDVAASSPISIVVAEPRGRAPTIRAHNSSRSIAAVGVPWVAPVSIRAGDVPLTAVRLSDGHETVAEVTSPPWLLSWTPQRIGPRQLVLTAIDSDGLSDTLTLDLIVCGDSGLLRIGHRDVTDMMLDGDSAIDWLYCGTTDSITRRPHTDALITYEALGVDTHITDPLMPAITWNDEITAHRDGLQSSAGGFRWTAASGSGQRRLSLLLGVDAGAGALSVELDDASAAPLRDETVISGTRTWQLVTVDFRGGTGPTRVRVEWTPIATSQVRWSAAVLRDQ